MVLWHFGILAFELLECKNHSLPYIFKLRNFDFVFEPLNILISGNGFMQINIIIQGFTTSIPIWIRSRSFSRNCWAIWIGQVIHEMMIVALILILEHFCLWFVMLTCFQSWLVSFVLEKFKRDGWELILLQLSLTQWVYRISLIPIMVWHVLHMLTRSQFNYLLMDLNGLYRLNHLNHISHEIP